MFPYAFLLIIGILFSLSIMGAIKPKLLKQRAASIKPIHIMLTGVFGLIASSWTLTYYVSVLYPLDMITLPLASIVFFIAIVMLLYTTEACDFIAKALIGRREMFLRIASFMTALAGTIIVYVSIQ